MKKGLYIIAALCLLVACKEHQFSNDPGMRLSFSCDSICFDTVFTGLGSSTQQVMIYNRNANAIRISRVWLDKGDKFFINIDGENNMDNLRDIEIYGKDSIFLFVRTQIDPYTTNALPLEIDTIRFLVNGSIQSIGLQAFGMNVHRMNGLTIDGSLALKQDSNYLIYDSLVVKGKLTIPANTMLYMHNKANIKVYGGIDIQGEIDRPVTIMGDRLDKLFEHVPYRVASGQWGGLYLIDTTASGQDWKINHAEIIGGSTGIYCVGDTINKTPTAQLHITNSRIHNHAGYGVVTRYANATIINTEISNCASYLLYLGSGQHTITYTTIAGFFGFPNSNLNIHQVRRENVPAVLVDSAASVNICNSIITGVQKNNLVVADTSLHTFPGKVEYSYLRNDSLAGEGCQFITYAGDHDTVFKNVYYMYKKYEYFDFRLDSVSPARGIGLYLDAYPNDRNGIVRKQEHPDAGCYEWQ